MKNLLIAASLLLVCSSSFAQEKGSKNVKPIKAPSSVSKGIGSEIESYKTGSGNVKPIKGQSSSTSTKVVRPSKTTPVKVQRVSSNTSTRANSSKVNNSPSSLNEGKVVKGGSFEGKTVDRRAASSKANNSPSSLNEGKVVKGGSFEGKTVDRRNTINKENPEAKTERPERKKEFNSQYCKGWVDGYKKAYSKISKVNIELSDIPKCEMNGKCEEYECGYRAGMMKAELKTKR